MITRRDYFLRCYWWKVKEDYEFSKLKYNLNDASIFFAKEIQPFNRNDEVDNGIINISRQGLVIETKDDISGIGQRDLVECLGQKWIVESVESQLIQRRTQYYNRPKRIWWLTLRNGE